MGQTKATIPTALVVEDEVLVRIMIADEMRRAGLTVIEAGERHRCLAGDEDRPPDPRLSLRR
jgi:hypothetical protein